MKGGYGGAVVIAERSGRCYEESRFVQPRVCPTPAVSTACALPAQPRTERLRRNYVPARTMPDDRTLTLNRRNLLPYLPTAAPLDTHTDTHICTPGELPLLKEGRARSGPSAYRLPDRPHDVQAGPRQTGCQAKFSKINKKSLGSWPADSRNTPPGSPRGQAHGIGRVSHWDGDAENSPR